MILDPNSEAGQIIEALCGERDRLRADLARVTAERDTAKEERRVVHDVNVGLTRVLARERKANEFTVHELRATALSLDEAHERSRALVAERDRMRAVVEAARAVTSAADACDREAENHPSSRSSAPLVRYINAMARLRAALAALDGAK